MCTDVHFPGPACCCQLCVLAGGFGRSPWYRMPGRNSYSLLRFNCKHIVTFLWQSRDHRSYVNAIEQNRCKQSYILLSNRVTQPQQAWGKWRHLAVYLVKLQGVQPRREVRGARNILLLRVRTQRQSLGPHGWCAAQPATELENTVMVTLSKRRCLKKGTRLPNVQHWSDQDQHIPAQECKQEFEMFLHLKTSLQGLQSPKASTEQAWDIISLSTVHGVYTISLQTLEDQAGC